MTQRKPLPDRCVADLENSIALCHRTLDRLGKLIAADGTMTRDERLHRLDGIIEDIGTAYDTLCEMRGGKK